MSFAFARTRRRRKVVFSYSPGTPLTALGATFSRGSTATYVDSNGIVQTASSGTARDGHYISGVRSLLLEGQRTNLILQSQAFTSASWSAVGAGTVTDNTADTTAPDGTQTACKHVAAAGTLAFGRFQSFTYTAAAYTFSIFAKKGTHNFLTLDFNNAGNSGAVFNLNTGVVGFTDTGVTATMTALGNGWYYCTATSTRTATASFPEWYLSGSGTANTRTWTAVGTEALYVWGAGLELASFASSYIPTTTVAVTRSADNDGFPWAYVPQVGTFYVSFIESGTLIAGSKVLHISQAAAGVPVFSINSDGTHYRISHFNGTSSVTSVLGGTSPTIGQLVELRGVLNADGSVLLGISINGGAETLTTTSGALAFAAAWSAPPLLWLNSEGNTTGYGFGAYRSVKAALAVKSLADMRSA